MKNAIIIHGILDDVEEIDLIKTPLSTTHWFPWLKQKLVGLNIETHTPDFPDPFDPIYEKWKEIFEQLDITPDTILVGHSCGGGFLVRWLSENKIIVGKVALVAPWSDPNKLLSTGFFNFVIDPGLVSRTAGLIVMYSLDDQEEIIKTVDELKAVLPQATFKEFSDKGHFTEEDMGTKEFPELLEVLGL
ncbi:MAG: alpha/beta hydrolase [Patescibacteria group bacterium]